MSPDDLKRLSAQFVQAASGAVQSASSYIPEVANYAKANFLDPITKQGISGSGALAGEKAKQADQADEAARQAKIQSVKDQMDPSKYTRVRKADGGFSFYDPSGKEIDINRYSQMTGHSRADVLSDSENPVDMQYLNDFKKMQDAMNVMYGGSAADKAAFLAANPDLRGRNIQDFATDLIRKYPHMYGRGGSGGQAYQSTLKNMGMNIFNSNYATGSGASTGGWSPS